MSQVKMGRCRFLASGTATLATGLLPWSRASTVTATTVPTGRRIDVHGHAVLPSLEALLAQRGSRLLDGRPLPTWSPAAALAFADRERLDLQVLSTPDPALALAPPATHIALARALNEELAAVVSAARGRFGGLAVLPLTAGPTAMLTELRYALDTLKLDGVILPTSVEGRYLGDARYAAALSALAKRRTPILVHPATPRPQDWPPGAEAPADTLEHAFSTVRCAASLLYAGASVRYPGLQLTFAAGGGGLPFMSARVAIADQAIGTDLFVRPLRSATFDTAQSASPGALASIRAFVNGPRQMPFGSDWPLVADPLPLDEVLASLPAAERDAVAGGGALRAFPSLARRLAR